MIKVEKVAVAAAHVGWGGHRRRRLDVVEIVGGVRRHSRRRGAIVDGVEQLAECLADLAARCRAVEGKVLGLWAEGEFYGDIRRHLVVRDLLDLDERDLVAAISERRLGDGERGGGGEAETAVDAGRYLE